MRCSNCGWDNPNGLTKCEKCGSLLSGVVAQENSRNAYESSTKGTAMEGCADSSVFRKTVCEASVFDVNAASSPSEQQIVHDGRCPKCGYPLRPDVTVCPKCHNIIHPSLSVGGAKTERDSSIQEVPVSHAPKNHTLSGGTIMPGMKFSPSIYASLTPLPLEGERQTPEKIEFEEKHQILNRGNIDPKNFTITSKEQAVLEYNETKKCWYIQDKSALHSTFLHCAGEMPIVDGDVVLMGDRRFTFHVIENSRPAENKIITGTIAVGRQHMNAPSCVLTPIMEEGETDCLKELTFRGTSHQLNRANLDPDNYTITSRVQAELTYENEQWFIKDCSQLQTTYLLCQDPIDLKDGDRILIGNRVFVFNC